MSMNLTSSLGSKDAAGRRRMITKAVLPKTIDLHIEPGAVKYTGKGPCYNARLHSPDGEVIVCSTEPLFAACRELVKRGITGQIRKYRNGMLCAEGCIEQFAKLTVYETDRDGPYVVKWQPPKPMTEDSKKKLRLRARSPNGPSPAAETPSEVPNPPQTLVTEIRDLVDTLEGANAGV